MTGAEAVTLLQQRCGQRANLVAGVVAELNAAQQMKLEKGTFYPWFLNVDDQSSLATVAGQEWVNLPVDFLGFDEELGGLWFNDASGSSDPWVPIGKDLYVNFKERYRDPLTSAAVDQSTNTGPEVFDIIGTKLFFRPIPQSVLPLRILYVQKQAAVVNDTTTNLWLTHAHDWLLGEAGIMMAGFQRQDSALAEMFATMATAGHKRCFNETIMRQENARMASMGEDE